VQHEDSDSAKQVEYEQLLYPAFILSPHAMFGLVTKWLVYSGRGRIQDRNPLLEQLPRSQEDYLNHRGMQLPQNLVGMRLAGRMLFFTPFIKGRRSHCALTGSLVGLNEAKAGLILDFLTGIRPPSSVVTFPLILSLFHDMFQGLCVDCFHLAVTSPEQYNARTDSSLCLRKHGRMTWYFSGIRHPFGSAADFSLSYLCAVHFGKA
jgi:hypothetical protein